ncbi:Uncharacterised protein [Mycobacteroides abscessus subsp. abscessus]|nr:Uncharacterised protein [Mycobacteroides abscessus subsp. abscessus]
MHWHRRSYLQRPVWLHGRLRICVVPLLPIPFRQLARALLLAIPLLRHMPWHRGRDRLLRHRFGHGVLPLVDHRLLNGPVMFRTNRRLPPVLTATIRCGPLLRRIAALLLIPMAARLPNRHLRRERIGLWLPTMAPHTRASRMTLVSSRAAVLVVVVRITHLLSDLSLTTSSSLVGTTFPRANGQSNHAAPPRSRTDPPD